MSVLIGLGFRAKNGKDEAARAIITARGADYDVRRYAFADELKIEVSDAICDAGNITNFFSNWDTLLPTWVVLEADPDMTDPLCPFGKYRTLLQWWGSEYRRAQDENYWVRRVEDRIAKESPNVALVTDVRFPNELAYIKHNSGYKVKVTRTGFVSDVPQHHSETNLEDLPMADWDYQLCASTVDELRRDAVAMFDEIAHNDSRVVCRVQT